MENDINLNSFERAWEGFLSEHARAINKIFHGQAIRPSAQIVARIRHERLHDPLLKYLRLARNDLEHTIQKFAAIQVAARPIRADENSPIISMSFTVIAEDGTTHTVASGREELLVVDGSKKVLTPIPTDNGLVPVPDSHLGFRISDPNPYEVARLGLEYLNTCLMQLHPYCSG